MRSAIVAGLLLAAGAVSVTTAAFAQNSPSQNEDGADERGKSGAEPTAAAAATPTDPTEALLAADLPRLVADARANFARDPSNVAFAMIVFVAAFEEGDLAAARNALEAFPDGVAGSGADMFEPFLLVAEGNGDFALERLTHGAGGLPDPFPLLARALVLESLGRLEEAADLYGEIEALTDTRPGPDGEPNDEAELMRAINATRTSQMLYRAAQVNHRLGRVQEAGRLYGLVAEFSANSADLVANRARLAAGQPPLEPALDAKRALGRWLFYISDFLQMTEGLVAVLSANGPVEGLTSPTGTMLLQFGLQLDPSAEDWTIAAAQQLSAAKGYAGAVALLNRIPEDSVWAADVQLSRASLFLEQDQDDEAAQAAQVAARLGSDRWALLAGAADVLRNTGRDREAVAALDRALSLAADDEDRASVLAYRAYVHDYFGRGAAAVRDIEAALALHRSDNIRYTAVAIFMDQENRWSEAVAIAREMFAESPDSSNRLNSLGYTLIQRPEGLEEGYRLLWRGFSFRETDYAVVDSLGWAYYLYGHFNEARALIERSHELTGDDHDPEILDHLGDVYWRLGDQDRARETWRLALDARPEATRRRVLEDKIRRGLRTPAPVERELPRVELPTAPRERGDT